MTSEPKPSPFKRDLFTDLQYAYQCRRLMGSICTGGADLGECLQAVQSITSVPLIGSVLNDLTFNLADRDSYHSYEKSYHEYYKKERKKK